jgi:DNA adenine methylase
MTSALLRPVSARPFLKWAGGKRQLLEQFAPLYPPNFDRYIEPFVGSAAVFFNIRERVELRFAALSDNNEELINCYRVVRDEVEALIRRLRNHKTRHHESLPSHYYAVRDLDLDRLSPVQRAARLIYLNKAGYNGLYRVNKEGRFNVPVGSYKDPPICDPALLRAASAALQNVPIEVRDFESWLADARARDFFYIDPPYVPLSRTANFTSYVAGGFGNDEQSRLASFARDLAAKGARFMVSNSDTALVRKLYKGFEQKRVRARRAINSNGKARGEISELVIMNYVSGKAR